MKRNFTILIILLLTLSAGAQTVYEGWMAGLPDSLEVCRVSVPGTHDSGTSGVRFPMRHYARTQKTDLDGQWDAGIRFFDLRPRLEDGNLLIYHGPADCHITFREALLMLKAKLELNPTEFCIVMTNSAGGGQTAVDMTMDVINSVFPLNMLASFHADMTVADMRGRVLFIHRDHPTGGREYPGTVVHGWPGNASSHHAGMVSCVGESAVLWAQDYFTDGGKGNYVDSKWDKVTALVREFASAPDGVWCINHLSGYTGSGISTNIKRNAKTNNVRLLEYLGNHKKPIGIVPMDFPQQELIDAIIFLNTFATE